MGGTGIYLLAFDGVTFLLNHVSGSISCNLVHLLDRFITFLIIHQSFPVCVIVTHCSNYYACLNKQTGFNSRGCNNGFYMYIYIYFLFYDYNEIINFLSKQNDIDVIIGNTKKA